MENNVHADQVPEGGKKLRVAAYCRVSTDEEEQESSFDAQCTHYTELISSTPAWTLAGIYADEGISGTSTRNRTQFNRMLKDCEDGLIDMVITKSISRWARNTADSLNSIKKLRSLGIPVYFEKESISTADEKGEVLLTILSSLAQQESDSISKNVRIGIQYRMQQGKRKFNAHALLGYSPDGSVNPAEADIIRRIFRLYMEGNSPDSIAAKLTAAGIRTATGRDVWNPTSIQNILENEKYCGDFLMQKYYVKDFLSHSLVKNNGALPQYLITDDHDPIVPREVWLQVQEEIQRRAFLRYNPELLRMGSREALTGRLVCGTCRKTLRRHISPKGVEYRCMDRPKKVTRYQPGRCTCAEEKDIKKAILKAFNELPEHKNKLLRMAGKIEYALSLSPLEALDAAPSLDDSAAVKILPAQKTKDQMQALQKRADLRNQFLQIHMLVEMIDQMEERRSAFWKYREPEEKTWLPYCRDFDEFMERTRYVIPEDVISASGRITEFDDAFVIRFMEKVTVNKDSFSVKFKAGITVSILRGE